MVLVIPVFVEFAFKAYIYGKLRLWHEPYASAGEPVIGELSLPAFLQLLLEDTVFIADGVTHSREALCSKSVQIAGSKSAQTAVSKTCIRLVIEHLVEVDGILFQHLSDAVGNIQIVQTGLERAAHEEFHGEIVYLFPADRVGVVNEALSLFAENAHDDRGEYLIHLLI